MRAEAAPADGWDTAVRSAFLFDTSAIGSSASVKSGVFSVLGNAKLDDNSATPDLNVYSSNPASDDDLVNADYATFGTDAFSTPITYGSLNIAGYNDFNLNAAGLAAVSTTGISKLGCRNANYDVADELDPNNHDPNWVTGKVSSFIVQFAETAGTASDPKLVVTFSVPSPSRNLLLLGVG
jgi:hypothetical protein